MGERLARLCFARLALACLTGFGSPEKARLRFARLAYPDLLEKGSHATSISLRFISVRAAPYTLPQKQSDLCKRNLSVFVVKCMALVFAKMSKLCIDRI